MAATSVSSTPVWNLPNQITALRLVISGLLFGCLAFEWYWTALVLFVVAASTDWIDGYIARKYNLVTQVGRILDPFADKLLILGTFVFLAAAPESGVPAWMAVIVLARELLVTVLRSFLEQQGRDFSAQFSGKLKMVFQCILTIASLIQLGLSPQGPAWLALVVTLLAWITILSTIHSGWGYVVAASSIWSVQRETAETGPS